MSEDYLVAHRAGADRNHTSFGLLPHLPLLFPLVWWWASQGRQLLHCSPQSLHLQDLLAVEVYLPLKHRWEGLILPVLFLVFFPLVLRLKTLETRGTLH